MSNPSSPAEALRIDVEHRGNIAVMKLSGSANMDVSGILQDRLYELVDSPIEQLVVDLSGLEFVSSVGLGAIIAAHLRCRHHRCVVKLVAPQPRILELLDVTKLTRLFPIHRSVEEAVTSA
jgi:anti-sigma B factor antagonist